MSESRYLPPDSSSSAVLAACLAFLLPGFSISAVAGRVLRRA